MIIVLSIFKPVPNSMTKDSDGAHRYQNSRSNSVCHSNPMRIPSHPSKCFGCDIPGMNHGTKCFSCERQMPGVSHGTKCFSCEKIDPRTWDPIGQGIPSLGYTTK